MRYSDQFRTTVAPPAETIRRRLRRRRIKLAAVTGAAATMLAAGAVAALAATLPAGHSARPVGPHRVAVSPLGWLPAGPQLPANSSPQAWPFVVSLPTQGEHFGRQAKVINWMTGAALGQITAPGGKCFVQVMGAADDRTFLLAAFNCKGVGGASFYELRLTSTGHPRPLIRISLPRPAASYAWLGLAPDGGHVAYTPAQRGTPNKTVITVIDLMTGKERTWSGPGQVTAIDWAGSHIVDFGLAWNSSSKPTFKPAERALEITAPGHRLLAARLLPAFTDVHSAFTNDPLPAANGVMYGDTSLVFDHGLKQRNEIARYTAARAKPTAIFKPGPLIGHNYSWCDPLWTDASGAHALAVCGTPNRGLQIDGGHMHVVKLHFPVSNGSTPAANVFYFAF